MLFLLPETKGKTLEEIERRWLELTEDPLTCCMEICETDPEACPYAKNHPETDRG
jgi:hypothetical protein